ncbi:MAG TPA: hypothetical protein VFJ98_00735 [Mycobacteriales bacterium]|nr:hypothetical protein [Mycobacteriales bacterium]
MIGSTARLLDLARRRGTVIARTSAAAGLSLTLAGALAPGSPAAAPAAGADHGPASLRSLLNPSGAESHADPAEEMAAQQAFAAKHFGAAGLSAPYATSRAIQQSITQAAAVPASPRFRGDWRIRGPKSYFANDPKRSPSDIVGLGFQNLSGRVTAIATTPRRPDQVWVGAADGGVWKSTDAGKSWTPTFDRQGTLAIGGIAVDPTDPDRVYVGTGEANTNADAYYGNGIYVTNNGGRRWSHVHLPGVLTVFHVEAAKPSPGFPEGRVFAATNNGLWLSTDHGRHYVNVKLPTDAAHKGVYTGSPFGNFVTDVRVRPHHVNEVVAVVGWRGGAKVMPNGKAQSVGNGFYRSTRSGARLSFRYVPQQPGTGLGEAGNDANPVGTSQAIGRTSLAYSADGKYLWAVVQDAGNFRGETYAGVPLEASNTVLNGVYVSTTGDPSSWTPKGNSQSFSAAPGTGLLVEQALLYAPGVQAWYDQWISVDPRDDNRVLVGLEEVYEAISNPYGPGLAQWRTVSRYWNGCAALNGIDCSDVPGPAYAGKTTHPDQHAAAFVPLQNGVSRLYTGSDGGIFSQNTHTTDLGYVGYDNSHWKWLNLGLATTQPYYAVEGSGGTIYAGLQDNGEVKIGPGSTRGDEVYGGDGFDTAVVPGNDRQAYEEYTYGDVSVTTDGGQNWTDISPCDIGSSISQFATPFLLDPRNANHVVEVGRYIDESVRGINTSAGTSEEGECLDPGGWATTYDLGASKVNGKPGVSGGGANNIATAVSVNGAHMYVPFCGLCDPVSQGAGNLSYFHNGIATNVRPGCTAKIGSSACWHKAAAIGLPNRYVQGVAIDPRNPRTVYVALSGYLRRWFPNPNRGGSVYVSHDAGQHFSNATGNLPHTPANSLVLRNGTVFVGTDLGVYSAAQGSTSWRRLGRGLPNSSVLDLRLNPQGSHLVAALHGRGVWVYDFGAKAAPAYRQHGPAALPPIAGTVPVSGPGGPSGPSGPGVDPTLLAAGLLLLLVAAGVRSLASRPARVVPTA